jgi:uncharacterized protein YjbI with pentapeptide repeats
MALVVAAEVAGETPEPDGLRPEGVADIEDNFRKTFGQLLGGAAVLVGAGFAYLQFTQQQQSSHDLLISNQVAKGFELLGNKDNQIQQRLGGIYALEGVMNTSQQYHQPVLEALSAFVRDGTQTATGDGPPATDIQAALTVIGRRKIIGPEQQLNLANAHIPKANLSTAHLSGADLSGADLRDADLNGARLNDANLRGATLNDAHLTGATLDHANLFHATLSGATLLNANLDHADLTGADLRGATLNDAHLDSANLDHATLTVATLIDAHLDHADLTGADLSSATVSQEQLDEACGKPAKLDFKLTLHQKPCPPAPK